MNQEQPKQLTGSTESTQPNNNCEKLEQSPLFGFVGLSELREELRQAGTLGYTAPAFTELGHTKGSPEIEINFNAPVTINIIKG